MKMVNEIKIHRKICIRQNCFQNSLFTHFSLVFFFIRSQLTIFNYWYTSSIFCCNNERKVISDICSLHANPLARSPGQVKLDSNK
jgi:hypothetical protein